MTKLKTRALAPTTAAATVGNNVVSNNEFWTQGKSKGVLDIATVGLTESCNGLTVSNKSGHMDGINSDVTNVVLNSVNKEIAAENQTTLGEPPRVQAAPKPPRVQYVNLFKDNRMVNETRKLELCGSWNEQTNIHL